MNAWIRWFVSLFTCNLYLMKYNKVNNENIFNTNNHYKIMQKIRNGISLEKIELQFIKTLSKEKLIEIIEINNTIIYLMNGVIKYETKLETQEDK